MTANRIFYRKQKLRGACWEYQIEGGWRSFIDGGDDRRVLHHHFSFYKPREVEVKTAEGMTTRLRWGAEQWFFPDRWFSLLRFVTEQNETVGYYVNFSRPLLEIKQNYYQDLDLELDLWLHPNGEATELDRDEFDSEIACSRLQPEWADAVTDALQTVSSAVQSCLADFGPDLDLNRDRQHGLPNFILRA
jgi:protein associated with RNAse G/E